MLMIGRTSVEPGVTGTAAASTEPGSGVGRASIRATESVFVKLE